MACHAREDQIPKASPWLSEICFEIFPLTIIEDSRSSENCCCGFSVNLSIVMDPTLGLNVLAFVTKPSLETV